MRAVGPARRHSSPRGRDPLHDHRQERRPRRHLVGELVPRRPRRCGQSLLLLLIRTGRPLDRVLLPARRAARLLRRRDAQVRHRRTLSVRDRGRGCDLRRGSGYLDGSCSSGRWHGRRTPSPCRHLCGRLTQPTEASRHPRHRRLRRPVVPFDPVGPLDRCHRHAVRARRRRRHRLPDRPDDRRSGRAAERFPANCAMDVPESELPRAGT